MIKGHLYTPSLPQVLVGIPPVTQSVTPFFTAVVNIPSLGVTHLVELACDSGADFTCLHLFDAARILGLPKYQQLRNVVQMIGIAGIAEYYLETAYIALWHHDEQVDAYKIELRIAKPSDAAMEDFNRVMPADPKLRDVRERLHLLLPSTIDELIMRCTIPSILGTDI